MIRVGVVTSAKDPTTGGVLKITPIDSNGQLSENDIEACQCSPNTGHGQGIFTIPGEGSIVLFVEVADAMHTLAQFLQTDDIPYKYVWLGAIAGASQTQYRGRSGVSNDKNDADESNNTQTGVYGADPRKNENISDKGIPEAGNVYSDNFIPQQDVWKHKAGHKFVMSHKITSTRHDNSMLLKSAGGKFIKIDDGPAEMKMDRIVIQDENKNRFVIKTGGTRPDSVELHSKRDQEFTTERGNQFSYILSGSDGSQVRHNYGSGDIEDKATRGSHNTEAEKDLNRKAIQGDIGEFADKGDITYQATNGRMTINAGVGMDIICGATTISLTPAGINIIGGTGDVLVAGISLTGHTHGGVESGAASTGGPQ